ncbi:MAG: hypothetical protein PUK75_11910 [bacterium]|nr:hypothetical protein [bacterium]MDY4098348.1 hypothetical protein [Lachnospiraceae bacterium]
MRKVFAWMIIAAAVAATPVSAHAAEIDTKTAVTAQQKEAKPAVQIGKRFVKPALDGEKKFAALPEGVQKPENGVSKEKRSGKLKTSGDAKPAFQGAKSKASRSKA